MNKWMHWTVLGLVATIAGCGQSDSANTALEGGGEAGAGSAYVAHSEPAGAVPVGEAPQDFQADETVTLVGLIGGSAKPFVEGLAAFTIVDPKIPYCAPDEGCPTPWDYCCTQDQVEGNIATVKVVDEEGKPVVGDARQLLAVKELSTVVVQGTAERDEQGNLTVAAKHVFVRPAQ
ncbi:MAG: hypothetical protein KDA45_12375 [Planctomycetales bacterium]|nr:hypothetical protein [Planctomycetales bacterium]